MKQFKNKLYKMSSQSLRILDDELETLAAKSSVTCDHLYDRMFCISVELIDRAVKTIPNAEKYIIRYKQLEIDVYFDNIHYKTFSIKDLKRGVK